jgi:hypothetical protein
LSVQWFIGVFALWMLSAAPVFTQPLASFLGYRFQAQPGWRQLTQDEIERFYPKATNIVEYGFTTAKEQCFFTTGYKNLKDLPEKAMQEVQKDPGAYAQALAAQMVEQLRSNGAESVKGRHYRQENHWWTEVEFVLEQMSPRRSNKQFYNIRMRRYTWQRMTLEGSTLVVISGVIPESSDSKDSNGCRNGLEGFFNSFTWPSVQAAKNR